MGMLGLDIGVRALKAQQRALDVTGHNIANANTVGYSRQRAELTATTPYTLPSFYNPVQAGQIGTGVEVSAIVRMRNEFVDERLHNNNALMKEWEQRHNGLQEIELILGEPSDLGLRSALDEFWSSLQELQGNAENAAIRSSVRQSALALTDQMTSIHGQLNDYRWAVDKNITNKVAEINTISQRVADLNLQISQISSKGENPNDLLDERDHLIDQLSELADIQLNIDSRNNANIMIDGHPVVLNNEYSEIVAVPNPAKDGLVEVKWKATNKDINFSSGEMAGLIYSRDVTVDKYINDLNTMAQVLISEFNQIHQQGYGLDGSTGTQFFTGKDASDIGLTADILDEVNGINKIAAALDKDAEADGRNALNLSQIMETGVLNSDKATMGDFWGGIVSSLGIDSQRAEQMVTNFGIVVQQLTQQRESISGVSLDEEMTNIIRFQQGYNAAAKLIQTQSEMLDILNGILK